MVIIWDYHEKKIKASHEIHKVRVEDVCFSCESNYLISLGGRDDGNVVIWDVNKNDALCGDNKIMFFFLDLMLGIPILAV